MYFALVSSRENSESADVTQHAVPVPSQTGYQEPDNVPDKEDEVFVPDPDRKFQLDGKQVADKFLQTPIDDDLDIPSISDYQDVDNSVKSGYAGRRHRGDHGSPSPGGHRHHGSSLPGGGTDMTLSELQEMATRQQHQIESQQQILVAKEQRLKYLKQQEQKQQQLASENDKLRKLRDKVETQEMKLKKLRSLRGQVEQQKASNGNLNYELESIKSLFNEKEKELAMAVAKVEEMTRQLEDIRSGRVKTNTNNQSPAAMAELEKLKKELMIRNKLNEQQNSKMGANRELLMKRKDEVARMDNRILELQMRLKKKRADAEVALRNKQQPVNNNTQNLNNKVMNRPIANVAPVESNVETKAGFGKNDPKYQSLPPNSKFLHPDKQNTNREANNNKVDFVRYEADKSDEFSVPLVVTVDNSNKNHTNNVPSPKSGGQTVHVPHPGQQKPSVPDNHQTNARFGHNIVPPRSGMTHFTPRPFGSTYSTSVVPDRGSGGVPHDQPHFDLQEEVRQAGSGQSSPGSVESLQNGTGKVVPPYPGRDHSHNKPQTVDTTQHLKGQGKESNHKGKLKDPPNKGPPVPVRSTNGSNNSSPTTPPTTLSLNTSTHPNTANNTGESDPEQSGISVSKGIQKFSGLIAQNQGENPRQQQGASTNSGGFSNLNHASALGAVRSAPTYRYASKSVIANTYLGKLDNEALEKYQKSVLSLHANLNKKSETQADSVKQVKPSEKSALHEEEKDSLSPLSSVSSPASSASTVSPVSPSQQQNYPFDFPVSPPHADVASDKVSYKPNTPKNIRRRHSDSDNEEVGKALHKYNINMNSNKNVPSQENQMRVLDHAGNGAVEIQATTFSDHIPETVLLDSKGNIVEVGEGPGKDVSKVNNNINSNKTEVTSEKSPEVPIVVTSKGVKLKSNIRRKDRKHNNRVSFDPLALLLDASLEGEVDLVRRCAHQVENVSASNDEGITALHNAICAGHYDIVTFLVEFGCDVNSPDSDGWTPLHCAASCNNLPMVKFLVEHGACIFATTISDQETAAEKCEEDEDGYDGCSEYLYSIQEKMGIINGGAVYAVFDYAKQRTDELALNMGNKFIVLKKGDDVEKDWWWAKCDEKHGYIPKNLLGLTPRVIPQEQLNGEV